MTKTKSINTLLRDRLQEVIKDVYDLDIKDVPIEHPENRDFGDLATSIPLVLAARVKQDPLEIAKKLVYELDKSPLTFASGDKIAPIFTKVETAPPGFINLTLSTDWLNSVLFSIALGEVNYGAVDIWFGRKIMVEFTDPNPFKVFHIGHVMTNTIGESLARIFEFLGADVKRANYQGDVGIHVANSIWGLIKKMRKDNLTLIDLEKMELKNRVVYLGQAYSLGATAYEEDESAKKEIQMLNNYIYVLAQKILTEEEETWITAVDYESLVKGKEPPFNLEQVMSLYRAGRKWSLEYFETLYKILGTKFDHYYFERQAGEVGWKMVKEHIADGVFKEDQGAVIFEGEKYGLHTRVFINSMGLPVYEAKDLGLAAMKFDDFAYDRSFIITGNEVNEYFMVVLKALAQIDADLAAKNTHIGHGMMVLKHGKMSSRTGDIIAGEELLDVVKGKVMEKMSQAEDAVVEGKYLDDTAQKVAVASVKYSILKSGIGSDITYDEEEATDLIGNTGPYLLYTYTRARSVLEKANYTDKKGQAMTEYEPDLELSVEEKDVLRHIYKFSEQVKLAGERLAPNLIAGFVFELAQRFNTFYAKIPIIKAPTKQEKLFRLHLTAAVAQVMHDGLYLLGIPVVDKM